jgi:RNA polymerase sigma factor (sigma-70 family)
MENEKNIYTTRLTLLEKLKDQHDDNAWRDFVYFYRGYIYSILRSMSLSHHDAEEVVQMVLLKSWRYLPEFNYDASRGRFRSWLGRVTANTAKNFMRRGAGRFVPLENEDGLNINEEEFFSNESEIDKLAEAEWREYLPELAWKNIKVSFGKNVCKVYDLLRKGVDVEGIAREVGISESSVYVYKKRVSDKLLPEIKRLEKELG